MTRPIQNPLGMSPDPTRTIFYTNIGAWWDTHDAHTLRGIAQGSFEVDMDATDYAVDMLVKFKIGRHE